MPAGEGSGCCCWECLAVPGGITSPFGAARFPSTHHILPPDTCTRARALAYTPACTHTYKHAYTPKPYKMTLRPSTGYLWVARAELFCLTGLQVGGGARTTLHVDETTKLRFAVVLAYRIAPVTTWRREGGGVRYRGHIRETLSCRIFKYGPKSRARRHPRTGGGIVRSHV